MHSHDDAQRPSTTGKVIRKSFPRVRARDVIHLVVSMIKRIGKRLMGERIDDCPEIEVVFDIQRAKNMDFEEEADQAYAMSEENPNWKIAEDMKCSLSKVTNLLQHAEQKHGLDKAASKRRSMQRRQKHRKPPLYIVIKDDVLSLLSDDLEIGEIAERLKCDRNTVTKTMAYLRETCGLAIPEGRAAKIPNQK